MKKSQLKKLIKQYLQSAALVNNNDIILKGLQIYSQLKILHWQASKHSHHIIFEQLYKQFDQINDQLVEIILSNNIGGSAYLNNNINILDSKEINNYSQLIQQYCNFYQELRNDINNTTLQATLDQIIALFKRNIYLLLQQ